ncbi:MAG: PilZ domain-containing protein [Acidobacteriota bacterium]|nr:PilZ domain-containing protein [Acidobacteriota bacterium]
MRVQCDQTSRKPTATRSAERRGASRFAIALPVVIHRANGEVFCGIARDISASGLYVKVRRRAVPESNLHFLLTFPREVVGACRLMASCEGTILRRDVTKRTEGWALRIDRFEYLRAVD